MLQLTNLEMKAFKHVSAYESEENKRQHTLRGARLALHDSGRFDRMLCSPSRQARGLVAHVTSSCCALSASPSGGADRFPEGTLEARAWRLELGGWSLEAFGFVALLG